MNEGDVIEIVRSGFYASLLAAGPALLGALLTDSSSASCRH